MSGTLTPGGVFLSDRRLAVPRDRVCAAFSDPSKIALWWGPDGFTNTFTSFDFRPQGRWIFVMHGPDGANYANENLFLETAPEKIVIRHDCAPYFTLTVELRAQGNETHLFWAQAFDDAALAQQLASIILPANEQNLNRLQALL